MRFLHSEHIFAVDNESNSMMPTINNLKVSFPNSIEDIKQYIGLDKDFKRLCVDFEEVTEMIKYLEKSDIKEYDNTKSQIEKYKQLRQTLISEIDNFIIEEQ